MQYIRCIWSKWLFEVPLVEDEKPDGQHRCGDHRDDLQVMPGKNLVGQDSQCEEAHAYSEQNWWPRSHVSIALIGRTPEETDGCLLAHYIGPHASNSPRPIPAQGKRADGRDGGKPQYRIEGHAL